MKEAKNVDLPQPATGKESIKVNRKTRLYLRMDPETKRLATRASAMVGSRSLSEFVAQAIREKAARTLNEAEDIRLSNHDFEAFVDACSAESQPNRALMAAQNRLRSRVREGVITYAGRGESNS